MERFVYKKSAGITALSASFADFEYKKHCHEEYALGVTLRGIQQFNMNGGLQSSYQKGVMLFDPEKTHDGRSYDENGIDYVMLYIKPRLFLEILEMKEIRGFAQPIVYDSRLERSILNLADAIFKGKDESLCNELLLGLVDHFSQRDMAVKYEKNKELIKKAKEMIYYRLEKVLKLDDLCKAFGLSKFQFIRMFKANTGISPYQYFLNCKVEHAKQLIEKNKDVYEAVAACGFVDLTHLNRHFKSIYGLTAFEYMSQIK